MKQTDFGNIYAVYVLATVYVTKSARFSTIGCIYEIKSAQ